ncbi:ribonuclease H-like domain-containing protein [Mycena olivaceomarginata]|nr:ribonuclease H-like domain-containing protein [Mycena olivaceomarginata]
MEEIEAVRQPATWKSSTAVFVPSSKEDAAKAEILDTAEWKIYTDGSGIDGRIGAAAVLFHKGEERASMRLCLGEATHHTVFEGEGIGGCLALALLRKQANVEGPVTIIVDSQPAILATSNASPTPSHWIWDAWHTQLTELAKKHPRAVVTIRWAPGHIGILGNERADEEAKRAAQREDSTSQMAIPKIFRGDLPPSTPSNNTTGGMGFIEFIWMQVLQGQKRTFVVVWPHTALSLADAAQTPYPTHPRFACSVGYTKPLQPQPQLIVEPRHIISHIAYYSWPSGTYGVQQPITIFTDSLHRNRD